jgi:hypothetical protein
MLTILGSELLQLCQQQDGDKAWGFKLAVYSRPYLQFPLSLQTDESREMERES